LGKGLASGWTGQSVASDPNSLTFQIGQQIGGVTSGGLAGTGSGVVNVGIGLGQQVSGLAQLTWGLTGGAVYNASQGDPTLYNSIGGGLYNLATSSDARSMAWNNTVASVENTFTDPTAFSQNIGGGSLLGLLTGGLGELADSVNIAGSTVRAAEGEVTVYRAFGGDARAQGFSWTTTDPRTVSNFRDAAGLPSGGASGATNTADFLIQGKVNPADIIKSRSALPLDGNKGGLPELIIDPKNVNITDFSVLKP
jgi:hypothetical protein